MRRTLALLAAFSLSAPVFTADLIDFWSTPQRGANMFPEAPPDAATFRALAAYGATWVRLSFSGWKSSEPGREYLFGSLDHYQKLVPGDVAAFRVILDQAHAAGLKVVVTPLSLPGARWIQQNNDKFDDRLWSDQEFWRQSAAFWRDLADALKDHPAVAAYNLVNEPVPEKKGGLEEHASPEVMRAWYAKARGSSRDLPAFYAALVSAVRGVDEKTPVMLDAGYYAAADSFSYWEKPMADPRILYAYHMYEPWAATSAPNLKRATPYRYPAIAPFGSREEPWNSARVRAYLQQPIDWAKSHGVPINRMVAAEFGCVRRWPDCPQYLEDVLSVLEGQGVHWAFFSFRGDWEGFDYELGPDKLPYQYWEAQEKGRPYELKRGPNRVFDPIMRRLKLNAPR